MTLVLNNLSSLVSAQFGLNELVSAITIGKLLGSVFSRTQDSLVLKPITEKNRLHLKEPPPWLHTVSFGRDAVILGQDHRLISAKHILADVSIHSVEGIATFVVLVLRNVEPAGEIVNYVEKLLRGRYWIIGGGEMDGAHHSHLSSDRRGLDSSMRNLLSSFVNSIIDSDKASPQHFKCLSWIYRLTQLIGGEKVSRSSTAYSRKRQEGFICYLLGAQRDGRTAGPVDTYSAGVAMIALAARANGANVRVECICVEDRKEVLPPPQEGDIARDPLLVRLWLNEPPPHIGSCMDVPLIGSMPPDTQLTGSRKITIYGGDREISFAVAAQIGCDCTPEQALALWIKGVNAGIRGGIWTADIPSTTGLLLRLSLDASLQAHTPLSRSFYVNNPFTVQQLLETITQGIISEVFENVTNDCAAFKNLSRLVLVSLALGCLKNLIRRSEGLLSFYAWTLDCTKSDGDGIIDFCQRAFREGMGLEDLLWTAARIWGGSNDVDHGHVKVHERVLGIASPQVTILSTILTDPRALALEGLKAGLLSLHQGSIPMLPRDPWNGFVIASKSPGSLEPRTTITKDFLSFPPGDRPPNIVYNLEPHQQHGSFSVILCGWYQGDVHLELDLVIVLLNLLQRGLACQTPSTTLTGATLQHLSYHDLLALGEFKVKNVVGIVRTERSADWVIAAAGCIPPRQAIIVDDATDADIIYQDHCRLSLDRVVVLCSVSLPPIPRRHLPQAYRARPFSTPNPDTR